MIAVFVGKLSKTAKDVMITEDLRSTQAHSYSPSIFAEAFATGSAGLGWNSDYFY